jgi:O-antigen/teichoic acid export membrane protein
MRRVREAGIMKGRSVFFNLTAVGAAEVVSRAAQLATVALMSRHFGPAGMGVIGTAWAFYTMAVPFVQYSPETMGIREIARNPWRLSVIGEINLLKLATAIGAAALLSALAALLYRDRPATALQIAVQSSVLIGLALSAAWVFRGMQHFESHAGIRVFQAVAMAVGLYLVLPGLPHPWAVPAVELATFLGAAAIGFLLLQRSLTGRRRSSPRPPFLSFKRRRQAVRRHGYAVATQGLTGLAAAVTWLVCIPEAGLFLAEEQVGNLAAALRLIIAVNAIIVLLHQLFFPILARETSHGPEAGRELGAALLFYVTLIATAAYGLLAVLAKPLCALILGPEFVDAAGLVQWMGVLIVVAGVTEVYKCILLAANQERLVLLLEAAVATTILVVNLVAFSFWPVPHAAMAMIAVMALHLLVLACFCHGRELIGRRSFALSRLGPSKVGDFLRAR